MKKELKYIGKIADGTDVFLREKKEDEETWMIENEEFKVRCLGSRSIKVIYQRFFDVGVIYNATRYDSEAQAYYLVSNLEEKNLIYLSETVKELDEETSFSSET